MIHSAPVLQGLRKKSRVLPRIILVYFPVYNHHESVIPSKNIYVLEAKETAGYGNQCLWVILNWGG